MAKTAKEILDLLVSMNTGNEKERARLEFEKTLTNGEFEAVVSELADIFAGADEKIKTYLAWGFYQAAKKGIDISYATDQLLEALYVDGPEILRDQIAYAVAAVMLQREDLKSTILDEVVIGLANKDAQVVSTCLRILEILTTDDQFKKEINPKFKVDLSEEVQLLKKLGEREEFEESAGNILDAISPAGDAEKVSELSKNLDMRSLEKLAEMGEEGADLSLVIEKAGKYLDSAYDDGIFAGRILKAAIESGKGREKALLVIGKKLKSARTSPNGLVLSLDLVEIASANGVDVSGFIEDVGDCLGIENFDNVRRAAKACLTKVAKRSDEKMKKRIAELTKKAN